jgi:DNA-binding MarR family transcriptional regulator
MARKKPATKWIDPALTQVPGAPEDGHGLRYLVRALNRAYTKVVELELAPHVDITYAQWSFIRVLTHEDGLSQRELADRLGLMENTTLVALNLMERRGWVRRERDKRDRRRLLVYLTEEGREVQRLRPVVRKVSRAAVADLDASTIVTTRRALKIMLANLEQELEDIAARPRRRPSQKVVRRQERQRPTA